jgi:acyl-coenzyme A thioesterase PaaI-like protein
MNLWPPFLANGIKVLNIAGDWSSARVVLKLHAWNRNGVGTQFGGNLFAMTDPFHSVLALHRLGPHYYVWDKAAEIEFVAPGRENVYAQFRLDDATITALREGAASGEKTLRWFDTDVVTGSGELVARVRKQLYVRLKPRARGADAA